MRLIALFVCLGVVLFGDDLTRTVVSVPPENARFQIVQSEMAAKATFKLDRFTGRVWQLLSTPDGNIWSQMSVESLSPNGVPSSAPRFHIFTSGVALKFTYLLDTMSGRTWEFASSEKFNDIWQLVPDRQLVPDK